MNRTARLRDSAIEPDARQQPHCGAVIWFQLQNLETLRLSPLEASRASQNQCQP
jgi:hypothetical protein